MSSSQIYSFAAKNIEGVETPLRSYEGKVLLIVNVASKCGFTSQYTGLEGLYEKYKDRGFEVLGFPCNQFGKQEPGDAEEIKSFCKLTYDVKFPLFAKVDVNGPATHPLYAYLKSEAKGLLWTEGIKWNFTKFLVGRDGTVQQRFAPSVKPEDLTKSVEAALAAVT